MLGETVKEFKLVHCLGKGGMGEVWAAEQQIIKTKVAIKFLLADVSSDKQHVQRFFNEAIAVSKIKHAGIVKIYDVGFHAERAYLIMEFLEGETLSARIARTGRLRPAQVVEIGRQIANILEATHETGITHRDLKPDNVFLVPDAELASKERVKILDFGIAKLASGHAGATGLTVTGSAMGTPAYMAPEQWTNAAKADARADIYSLGCVAFEMSCGRVPFKATSIGEACAQHLSATPPRVRSLAPETPPELDDVIARMLNKQPDERPTIAQIADVFSRVALSHPPGIEATHGVSTPPARVLALDTTLGGAAASRVVPEREKRKLAPVVTAAIGVLGLGGGAVGIYVGTHDRGNATPAISANAAPVAIDAASAPDAPAVGPRSMPAFPASLVEGQVGLFGMDGSPVEQFTGTEGKTTGTLVPVANRKGQSSGALRFSGHVDMDLPGLPVGASPRSLALWVRAPAGSDWRALVSWGTTDRGKTFGLYIGGSNACMIGYYADIAGNAEAADDRWHHVATTYDGTEAVLYVDGKVDGRTTVSLNTKGTHLFIGRSLPDHPSGVYPFRGELDEIRIYNRALTASEIAAIAADR